MIEPSRLDGTGPLSPELPVRWRVPHPRPFRVPQSLWTGPQPGPRVEPGVLPGSTLGPIQ